MSSHPALLPDLPRNPSTDNGRLEVCPRSGKLVPLRTKAEVEVRCQVTDALIARVPAKFTAVVLKAVDDAIRKLAPFELSHLRRVVKPDYLPLHVKLSSADQSKCGFEGAQPSPAKTDSGQNPNGLELSGSEVSAIHNDSRVQTWSFVLLCAASTLPKENLEALLLPLLPAGSEPIVSAIEVPLLPPTSEEEAFRWSQDYWPTVYKKHNPFGPHPAIVARATEQIQSLTPEYMTVAETVARDVSIIGCGETVGAVVVNRSLNDVPEIVVAAGDARWKDIASTSWQGNGNAMAHAVMRAIGLVARKRRAVTNEPALDADNGVCSDGAFADSPLTELEKEIFLQPTLPAGGYLCLDLELYVTHEPCVMCCMAILHSRFGKVVFGERMWKTGGLTADSAPRTDQGLGYGLFWRPSLNWKLLAWQWIDDDRPEDKSDREMHA